jgi:hypothetical protein
MKSAIRRSFDIFVKKYDARQFWLARRAAYAEALESLKEDTKKVAYYKRALDRIERGLQAKSVNDAL